MTSDSARGFEKIPAEVGPGALRPPAEYASRPLHWIRRAGPDASAPSGEMLWHWSAYNASWHWYDPETNDVAGYSGGVGSTGEMDAYAEGYRYLGPAEWRVESSDLAFERNQNANLQRHGLELTGEIAALEALGRVRADAFVALSEMYDEAQKRITELETKLRGAKDAIASITRADEASIAALQAEVSALNNACDLYRAEVTRLRADDPGTRHLASVESDPGPHPKSQTAPDNSTEAVQRRVEGVIDDLVQGRTTPSQRKGLGSTVERAGRVSGGADGAVGRAIGGRG